jgi:hypothetical protein
LLAAGLAACGVMQAEDATYRGILDEPVTLDNGHFRGEPYVAGGASAPSVSLLDEPRARGDLNGDGRDEIAVLLAANLGGSGTFMYLAVLEQHGGELVNLTTLALGDRVRVESLAIDSGRIRAKMREFGPDDPMCCPSQVGQHHWALQDGQLVTPN